MSPSAQRVSMWNELYACNYCTFLSDFVLLNWLVVHLKWLFSVVAKTRCLSRADIAQLVECLPGLKLWVSNSTIDPGFKPHQYLLTGMWKRTAWLPYWPLRGWLESHQRWIYRNMWHVHLHQVWMGLPTLALKPRGDVTRSPKQGYQWHHKKDLCHPKIFKKNKKTRCLRFYQK